MGWIEKFLNKPEIKEELGIPAALNFVSCNMEVNRQFLVVSFSSRLATYCAFSQSQFVVLILH